MKHFLYTLCGALMMVNSFGQCPASDGPDINLYKGGPNYSATMNGGTYDPINCIPGDIISWGSSRGFAQTIVINAGNEGSVRELYGITFMSLIGCAPQNDGSGDCWTGQTFNVINWGAVSASREACITQGAVTVTGWVTSYTNWTVSGPGINSAAKTFNASAAGLGTHTITFTGYFDNGIKTVTVSVTVKAVPQADLSFIPAQVCSGTTIVLTGSPTITEGGTLQSITVDGSGVGFNFPWSTTTGMHPVVYTVNNALCGNATTTKNVQVGTNYTLTANADYSLCEGSTLNLTSTTPPSVPGGVTGSGAWSMVTSCAGCLSGTTFTPPDIPSGSNQNYSINYAFSGSAGYLGCNKSVNKTITVKPKSDLSFANTSVQRCASGTLFLDTEFVPRANSVAITPTSWSVGTLASQYTAADRSINAGGVVVSGSQQTFPLSISYTNAGGCTSTSSSVSLILDKTPNAPANTNTAASLKACGSGTFTLTASGAVAGESYIWRNEVGTQVGGSGSSYSTGSLGVGTYIYSVAVRGVNSCESVRTNITINVYANPSIVSTVASLTKCTGNYTINLFTEYGISTGGSGTNNWTSTNSAVSSRLNATTGVLNVNGLTPTTNIPVVYRFTSTEGCVSTLNLTLNINSGVAVPVVDDVKNCEVGAANLTVKNPDGSAVYNWYDAASGGNLLGTGVGFTTASLSAPQNSSQSYSFYVSGTSSSCTSAREEVVVTVVNTDQIIAGPDLSFCDNTGKIADLRGAASPAGGTFSGAGVTYVGVTPVFNCGSDCGISLLPNNTNYTVTYTYTNSGCTYTDVRVISLGFSPVITVTPDISATAQEVQIGEFVKIEHNYTDATETTWTFVGESAGAFGNPTGRIYYSPGYKSVDVTIKRAGCTGTFTASNIIFVEGAGYTVITGTEDPIEALRKSTIYPNPVGSELLIESVADFKDVQFFLTNSLGKNIAQEQVDLRAGVNPVFNPTIVGSLPGGVYFLKIGQGNYSYTLKLIKQ